MKTKPHPPKLTAKEALELLEQAWAYYAAEQSLANEQREPELFEYANAA